MNIFKSTQENGDSNHIDDLTKFIRHSDRLISVFQVIDDDIKILAMSDMFAGILGYTPDEIIKIDQKTFSKSFEDYFTYVENIVNNEEYSLNTVLNLMDGSKLNVQFNTMRYIHRDEVYYLAYGIEQDRSVGQIYHNYYLNNLELYKKIVEMMSDGVFVEKQGRLVYANESAASLLGEKSRFNIMGSKISDYLVPEFQSDKIELRESLERYSNNSTPIEQRCKKTDGRLIDLDVSSIPINYHDEECVISVVRDVTQKKICERNLRRAYADKMELISRMIDYDNQKTEFFSNISHEFKTPLNVILGTIQLLEAYGNSPATFSTAEQRGNHVKIFKNLDTMKQNCYRLLRLINNLIDANKVDADFLDMYFTEGDIVKAVEDITLSIVSYALQKKINIVFDTNIEEMTMAFDAEKLERILLNLLSNSLKFTPVNGTIRVEMIVNETVVKIIISDTGIGIPKDKVRHIFNRFEQVKQNKRCYEGSGIGLYLVKSLVELHNGSVEVNSVLDEGTTFTINIPTNLVADSTENRIEKNEPSIIERLTIEFSDVYSS